MGLPWSSAARAAAWRYARLRFPPLWAHRLPQFVAGGTGWRHASWRDCLPSAGAKDLEDVTEAAGYGWHFFRDTARSRTRRALLPAFGAACRLLGAAGRSPSLALPYFNLVFRKR